MTMKHTRLTINETELAERLLPLLEGRAFHVSELSNLPAILTAGAIQPNTEGTLATTFGHSKNSYFRNRGCVSVFDLRTPPPDENFLWRCSPFSPARDPQGLAIFILSSAACADLLPWTGWKVEQAWGEMIAPYVEAGYRGLLPLTLIDELLEVVVVADDPDPLIATLLEARRRTGAPRGQSATMARDVGAAGASVTLKS
jgi:hypothetical protein